MIIKFNKRRKSREQVLQAIYSWLLVKHPLQSLENDFFIIKNKKKYDRKYFEILLYGIIKKLNELNIILTKHLNRSISSISKVEYVILLIACFELTTKLNIPKKVAINEAIQLSKIYGSANSYKFINATLDKIAFF
jgi:N utilization substance protein B